MGGMKYVKNFEFPSEFGFTGSAGKTAVSGHMRGGGKVHKYAKGGHHKAEGGKWIAGAIKHPGALRAKTHTPKGKNIPEKKLKAAEHSKSPAMRREAHLAETLKGMHHKAEGGIVSDNGSRMDKAPHTGKNVSSRADMVKPGSKQRFQIGGLVSGLSSVPASKMPKYARGGDVDEGPVRKSPKTAHEGEFADFKRGGRMHKASGGKAC